MYTQKQLIDFGNYLLSEQREENLRNPENQRSVTDADVSNWSETQNNDTETINEE